MKRLVSLLLLAALALPLCGCGSIFNEEYVVVGDYTPALPAADAEDRITVSNLPALRRTLLELVYAGEGESSIVFDADYQGEISEDMASACWQVRTQDALCASSSSSTASPAKGSSASSSARRRCRSSSSMP